METNLPTPMTARVYVNLPEGGENGNVQFPWMTGKRRLVACG